MIRITRIISALLLLLSVALPVESGVRAEAAKPLLVIVGNVTGITNISLGTLRRAFQGEPAEVSGKRLVPFNLPNGTAERSSFDRTVLGIEPADVGRFWIDRRIRAEGAPPRTVPSQELAVKVVASLPYAISYVSSSALSSHVRVLTIDGVSPSQAGYPFVVR